VTAFLIVVALVAAFTGGIASVSAIGIGSILTPLVAVRYDFKTAVAAVAIPHAAAMLLRYLRLRRHLDRRVLLGFGLMNAAGALAGALVHTVANAHALAMVLGVLLVLVGGAGLLGYSESVRLSRPGAWVAGALAGWFGGLVGSQGPLRSTAMLALDIPKEAFVATATAIGLAVDGARLPVYIVNQGAGMLAAWPVILTATVAVLAGTLAGERVLYRIPDRLFKRVVAGVIGGIGVLLLAALH
jgi:uncharacterized protein